MFEPAGRVCEGPARQRRKEGTPEGGAAAGYVSLPSFLSYNKKEGRPPGRDPANVTPNTGKPTLESSIQEEPIFAPACHYPPWQACQTRKALPVARKTLSTLDANIANSKASRGVHRHTAQAKLQACPCKKPCHEHPPPDPRR